MNNFELFKLKAAGLTNLNILNILDYQKNQDKKLSLRDMAVAVSYTHLRAHETRHDLVCRLLLEKKKKNKGITVDVSYIV